MVVVSKRLGWSQERLVVVLAALLSSGAISACGNGAPPATDAGSDRATDAGVGAAPPDIEWLDDGAPPIGIAPCVDGWWPITAEGMVTTCDPYPVEGAAACGAGEAHFPGEPGCAPVGSPCSGEFAAGLPTDRRVVYVRPGATLGDGSLASPFGSIGEFALGALPMGSVIALSRGSHAGPIRLARGLVLWGACAADTVVETSTPDMMNAVVLVSGDRGELRDLSVTASPRPGIRATSGAEVTISGVVVSRTRDVGILVDFDSTLLGRRVVVRDTESRSDGRFGRGLSVQRNSAADVSTAQFDRNHEVAVLGIAAGTRVTLGDVAIRDTQPDRSNGSGGRALSIADGANADLSRSLVRGNGNAALFASDAETSMTVEDVVVDDAAPAEIGETDTRALAAQAGASIATRRAVFGRARALGVYASGSGTTATLADVIVRDTEVVTAEAIYARGVAAQLGARVDADAILVERSVGHALLATDPGTTLSVRNAVVRGTGSRPNDQLFGRGIGLQLGAAADMRHVVFEDNRDVAVFASFADTTLTLTDVVIRDTQSDARDLTGGRALNVQRGATAQVTRTRMSRNREVGAYAFASGTHVTLTDVAVVDTASRECAETTCPSAPYGLGVASYDGAAVRMQRFLIARASLCGLHLATGGQADLESGEVREHPIGVCLTDADYDTSRLTTGVRYVDNETSLQAINLPLPSVADPVGSSAP